MQWRWAVLMAVLLVLSGCTARPPAADEEPSGTASATSSGVPAKGASGGSGGSASASSSSSPTKAPQGKTSSSSTTSSAQAANGTAGAAATVPEPFVVIAVVDSGVNAYHEDFRRPELTAHPSTYIPGYPADAQALELTFAGTYAENRAADAGVWGDVSSGGDPDLYWIPGTNIVGAKSYNKGSEAGALPILDDNGHGTGSASVATGAAHGSCPECLLVFIEGLGALEWALTQPWIDFVSNSYGPCDPAACAVSMPTPVVFGEVSKASSEAGQVVLFAAGNGMANAYDVPQLTYWSHYTGPDWIVTVGAVEPGERNDISGHGKPVDAASYGVDWPSAHPTSTSAEADFSGTSCATPVVAGAMGTILLAARRALGDTTGGHAGGIVAKGTPVPTSPTLADGQLTRAELLDLAYGTAIYPSEVSINYVIPQTVPPSQMDAVLMGWGVVDADSAQAAIAWMLGGPAPAAKPVTEAWMPEHHAFRIAIWGDWAGSGGLSRSDAPRTFDGVLAEVAAAAPTP